MGKCLVHNGPSFDSFDFEKHAANKNEETEANGMQKIEQLIKQNNKQKKQSFGSCDTFWNQDLSRKDKPKLDSRIKAKMDGLNDDFARLMAMQNKLLIEVDKKQKKQRPKKKKIKKMIQQKAQIKKGCFIPFEIAFYNENYYKNESVITWKEAIVDLKQFMDKDKVVSETDDDDAKDDSDNDLFADYMTRLSYDKTQCIRYCYKDSPLVPTSQSIKIPECEYCGRVKVFELQIMSPVLNYLEPKQIDHDWLTVLVYVCPLSCSQSVEQHMIVCCETC